MQLGDHVGNSIEIAKKRGQSSSLLLTLHALWCSFGGFPVSKASIDAMGRFGGTIPLLTGTPDVCEKETKKGKVKAKMKKLDVNGSIVWP